MSSGIRDYYTPRGDFTIFEKRPASRLLDLSTEDDEEQYNLPGVPFVCCFAVNGIATHGVYWHNDYGRPVSAGCINLTPDAARFIWQWSTPTADLDALTVIDAQKTTGTSITVY